MEAPKILFRTNIYHPWVDKLGRISVKALYDWGPALIIRVVLDQIMDMLQNPLDVHYDLALDTDILKHWKDDEEGARVKAKEWVDKYASE